MLLSSVLNLPAGSQEDSEPQGELDLEKDKLKMLIEVEMLLDILTTALRSKILNRQKILTVSN